MLAQHAANLQLHSCLPSHAPLLRAQTRQQKQCTAPHTHSTRAALNARSTQGSTDRGEVRSPKQPQRKRGRKPKQQSAEANTPEHNKTGLQRTAEKAAQAGSRMQKTASGTEDAQGTRHASPQQPVAVLLPPDTDTGATTSTGPAEFDFTWRGDAELDEVDQGEDDDDLQGHGASTTSQKLAAAAEAARLSFGLPSSQWSARRLRRAYERGQLPWGESPCLQDESLLMKAMQLVYTGGRAQGGEDEVAMANVGWGNRVSVRSSERLGAKDTRSVRSGQPGSFGDLSLFVLEDKLQEAQMGGSTPEGFSGSPQHESKGSQGSGSQASISISNSSSGSSSGGSNNGGSGAKLLPCPPRFVGRVEVQPIKGKGWGLVATDIIDPGETILVSEPLVIASSSQPDRPPPPQSLIPWLQRLQRDLPLDHPAHVALRSLWHGQMSDEGQPDQGSSSSSSSSGRCGSSSSGRDGSSDSSKNGSGSGSARAVWQGRGGRALIRPPDLVTWQEVPEDEENETDTDGDDHGVWGNGGQEVPLGELELQGLLLHNMFGDTSEDPAATTCRGERLQALVGVWPDFALINHACLPNAVHMLIGGRMVVRALDEIRAGEEIFVNYLGRAALAPLPSREEELQGVYSFRCVCARCRLERSIEREAGDFLTEASDAAVMLQEDVQEAIACMQHLLILRQQQQQQEQNGRNGSINEQLTQTKLQQGLPSWEQVYEWLQGLHSAGVQLRQELLERVDRVAILTASHTYKRTLALAATFEVFSTLLSIREALAAHIALSSLPTPQSLSAYPHGPHFSLGSIDVLQHMVELAEVAAPGSDLHTLLSVKLAQQSATRFGVSDSRTIAAEQTCVSAHLLRYGPCTTPVMDALMDAGLDFVARSSPFHPTSLEAAARRFRLSGGGKAREGVSSANVETQEGAVSSGEQEEGAAAFGVVVPLPSWLRDARDSSRRAAMHTRAGAVRQPGAQQAGDRDAALDTLLDGLLWQPLGSSSGSGVRGSDGTPSPAAPQAAQGSAPGGGVAAGDGSEFDDEEDDEGEEVGGGAGGQQDWKRLWQSS